MDNDKSTNDISRSVWYFYLSAQIENNDKIQKVMQWIYHLIAGLSFLLLNLMNFIFFL